jgi:hypothetical protein
MNKITSLMIISVTMLMSVSALAAGRPSVSGNEKRITAVEAKASQLEADLADIELTPGPQGDKGQAGAAGQNGANGQDGAVGGVGATGQAGADGVNAQDGEVGASGDNGQNGADGGLYDGVMYDGAFAGDMQYWNGNAWLMITAPTENTASLSFCDGQPTWTQGACPGSYAIGDVGPAGGWVFHVTEGGLHGLEVAPHDQDDGNGAQWGCEGESVPATSYAMGAGAANTAAILAHTCGITPSYGGYTHDAATLASSYSLNGVNDWYLPSIFELKLLYKNLYSLGKGEFTLQQAYWSSSELSVEGRSQPTLSYAHFFQSYRNVYPMNKGRSMRVRAIRGF